MPGAEEDGEALPERPALQAYMATYTHRVCLARDPEVDPLTYLRTTGEFSDLTIIAQGKSFKVHKCILCPSSPFFQTACTGGFNEARINVIQLSESKDTILALVDHAYGMTLPLFSADYFEGQTCLESRLHNIIGLLVAADKYMMQPLESDARSAFCCILPRVNNARIIVGLGCSLYEKKAQMHPQLLSAIVAKAAAMAPMITKEGGGWNELSSYPTFLKDVFVEMGKPKVRK